MASVTLTALSAVAGSAVFVAAVLGALVYRYTKLLDTDEAVRRGDAGEAGRATGPAGYKNPRPIKKKKKRAKKAKKGDLATPLHYDPNPSDLSRANSRRKSQSLDTLERVIRARSVTPITSFYGNRGIDVSGHHKYADVSMGNPPATQTIPDAGNHGNAAVARRFLGADFDIIDAGVRGGVAETSTIQNSAKTPPVVDPHNISLEGLVTFGSSKASTDTRGADDSSLHDVDGFGEWYDSDPELAEITTNMMSHMAGYGFDKLGAQPTLPLTAKARPSGSSELTLSSGRHQDFDRTMLA